jgi:fatty acid desaturase
MSRLAPPLDERNETELERSDRQLAELMQEVRVVQTGVQVLFGFLLTAAFTNRFGTLSHGERLLYFGTLAAAGAAAVLLIAPSSHHRILFRCGDKEHIVRMANRYAIAGVLCVGLAMVGALELVAIVVLGGAAAAAVAVVAAAGPIWCWYLQPLLRRRRLYRTADDRRHRAAPATAAATVDAG